MGLSLFYSGYSWPGNENHLRGAALTVCRQGSEELRRNAQQCLLGRKPMPLSKVSLSPLSDQSVAAQLPSYQSSQGMVNKPLMEYTGASGCHCHCLFTPKHSTLLLLSLLLDYSQLCEEHLLELSFLPACHWICFPFHLLTLIPIETHY